MSAPAITLHLLAAVIWVGGMFFAYLAVRPALADLDTQGRARLWRGMFQRFFPWVWACIAALLGSGFYLVFTGFDGLAGLPGFIHVMMGLGILMMLLFGHLFFGPYRRLQQAVAAGDDALAQTAMGKIRKVMLVNLILGIVVVLDATLGSFATFN